MKNKIKTQNLILAITLIFGIISCKKEKIEGPIDAGNASSIQTNYESVEFENNVISFESIESYEKLINSEVSEVNELKEYLNEINNFSYKNSEKQIDVLDDELMEVVFNEDLVVKIEDWLIKIIPEREELTVISSNETNAYDKLLLGRDDKIRMFSTSDDVLDLLQQSTSSRELFCRESGVASRYKFSKLYKNGIPLGGANDLTLEHKKYGIYYKIQIRFNSVTSLTYPRRVFIQYTQKNYKQRCRTFYTGTNSTISVNHNAYDYTSIALSGATMYHRNYTYIVHSGNRNYHKYWVRMRAGVIDRIDGNDVYNGTSNYIEIRANM